MSLNTQLRGQIGVNIVESIILNEWNSRFQPIDGHNDDGIDGLIFLEAGGEMTGQVIFAQVKCFGRVRKDKRGRFCLPVNSEKLHKNFERWRRLVGAAIVIYVDPVSRKSYWANARDSDAIKGSQIFVPEAQAFDAGAQNIIARLCGTIHRDLLAPHVETVAEDFPHLRTTDHIWTAARRHYRQLASQPVRLGGAGPIVHFDRAGWRHITRKRRPELTRYQSFVLLGAVRKILECSDKDSLKQHRSIEHPDDSFVTARAAVAFPFRQTGIVKVILRVVSDGQQQQYRFHTIYEPRRRRNVLGGREPLPR